MQVRNVLKTLSKSSPRSFLKLEIQIPDFEISLRNCLVFNTGQFFFDITGYFSEICMNFFDITGNNSVPGGVLLVPGQNPGLTVRAKAL